MVKIVYQANFGNEKIEKEEYQMCRKLYCQIKEKCLWMLCGGKKSGGNTGTEFLCRNVII